VTVRHRRRRRTRQHRARRSAAPAARHEPRAKHRCREQQSKDRSDPQQRKERFDPASENEKDRRQRTASSHAARVRCNVILSLSKDEPTVPNQRSTEPSRHGHVVLSNVEARPPPRRRANEDSNPAVSEFIVACKS